MAVNVVLTRKFFDADLQFIKNRVKEGANMLLRLISSLVL